MCVSVFVETENKSQGSFKVCPVYTTLYNRNTNTVNNIRPRLDSLTESFKWKQTTKTNLKNSLPGRRHLLFIYQTKDERGGFQYISIDFEKKLTRKNYEK